MIFSPSESLGLSRQYACSLLSSRADPAFCLAAVWLNELDQQAGSVQPKELYFHGSEWEAGGASRGPALQRSLTTYSIVDNFTDMLFNKNLYPNLNQVV